MAFNVVYSDKDRIQGAIESGVIPRESLVLTSDDAKRSEMYYYDDNGQLKTITKKTQFNSMVGARTWANKYDYIGEVISININGQWVPYLVDNNNEFVCLKNEGYEIVDGGDP